MIKALRLAPIFSDSMVLCRDHSIRIFGEAESGKTITVHLHHHTASCTAVKGQFEAGLPPMPPGGPHTLTVTDGNTTLSFADILIGDVYLAGGQSNMEMALKNTQDGARYTAQSDYPRIRYCNYPVLPYLDDRMLMLERKAKWRAVKPEECGDISAVAYHFAVRLQEALSVPVGIIGCNLGGTSVTAWLDEDALCATTGGKAYLEAFLDRIKDQTDEDYQKAYDRQQRDHAIWSRKAEAIKKKNPAAVWDDFIAELGPCPYPPPEGRKSMFRPCGLVNTMVKRIAPYTLTGFLYYQGESDAGHPQFYRAWMMSLIAFWRDLFRDSSLPFLYVQLPMFRDRSQSNEQSWAYIRQAQEQVFHDMRNTGLAVMIDGGEEEDIHPRDKKTVGERLCLQALNVVYHRMVDADGPRAVAARAEGNAIVVTVSAPLRETIAPRLLEVAGEDGRYFTADAVTDGTEIRMTAADVAHPRFARYAWINYAVVNVFGENGLPLAPFSLRG